MEALAPCLRETRRHHLSLVMEGFKRNRSRMASEEDPDKSPSIVRMFQFQGCSNLLLLFFLAFLQFSNAEPGTASLYNPPYTPSLCYGNDTWNFPTSNLFAAAGEGIWDDGAACGRQYLVKCIASTAPNTCKVGESIQVTIVDRAQTSISRPARPGTAIVLSNTTFWTIATPPAIFIVVEIQQI